MGIDDVLVLFPKLRPHSRVLQNLSRNLRQRFALLDDMHFKFVRICRILIRGDVPVRPDRQILRRRPLRHRLVRSLRRRLSQHRGTHDQCCQ